MRVRAKLKMEKTSRTKTHRMRKRGLRTREKILQASKKLFAKYGFAGTSMDEISEKVGIKKASLYHYFSSKHDIYFELVERIFEEVISIFQISFTSDDIIGDSEKFFRRIMEYISKNQDYIRIFVRELLDENIPVRQLSQKYLPALLSFGKKILDKGVSKSIFRKGIDPLQLALTVTGAIIIYFLLVTAVEPFLHQPVSKRAIRKRVKHLTDVILNGIRSRKET